MGPLLEFRIRAARPGGEDGRVMVGKGVLPCAGWRSTRRASPRVPPTGRGSAGAV